MKRVGILFVAAAMVLGRQPVKAIENVSTISAKSAIVYDADYGSVLWEKNSNTPMLIASTTKIMTAVIALEQCDLEECVMITSDMVNVEGSSMYLREGETYTIRELLYGLMLASGNDAATAIALHTAQSEEAFAELMNVKAKELGLTSTSFENPHGLDAEQHYSTAFDMARLMAYAMQNSSFAEIVGSRHTTIHGLTYVNHNKLLWQCDGVIGGKTGFTRAAGRTLVTCCERNGQRLICVTLSAPNDWQDHAVLYNWAYSQWQERTVLDKKTPFYVPMVSPNRKVMLAEPLSDVRVFTNKTDKVEIAIELPRFVFAPVYIGERAGRVLVTVNGKQVEQVPLIYMENYEINIENKKLPFIFKSLNKIKTGI